VREVKPEYAQAALNARIRGVVLLEAVVLTEGQVGDVRILGSLASKPGLDDQAVKARKAWRFDPGTRERRPVPVIVTAELTFRLK
jgi:TonB family protein